MMYLYIPLAGLGTYGSTLPKSAFSSFIGDLIKSAATTTAYSANTAVVLCKCGLFLIVLGAFLGAANQAPDLSKLAPTVYTPTQRIRIALSSPALGQAVMLVGCLAVLASQPKTVTLLTYGLFIVPIGFSAFCMFIVPVMLFNRAVYGIGMTRLERDRDIVRGIICILIFGALFYLKDLVVFNGLLVSLFFLPINFYVGKFSALYASAASTTVGILPPVLLTLLFVVAGLACVVCIVSTLIMINKVVLLFSTASDLGLGVYDVLVVLALKKDLPLPRTLLGGYPFGALAVETASMAVSFALVACFYSALYISAVVLLFASLYCIAAREEVIRARNMSREAPGFTLTVMSAIIFVALATLLVVCLVTTTCMILGMLV